MKTKIGFSIDVGHNRKRYTPEVIERYRKKKERQLAAEARKKTMAAQTMLKSSRAA
ncbi:MAG: hypothetical protein NTX50_07335 [Candidatus Sumerlaeota bacterium]|nr:hypothetical protein [Candidatus Sumerlaeota bacterium]